MFDKYLTRDELLAIKTKLTALGLESELAWISPVVEARSSLEVMPGICWWGPGPSTGSSIGFPGAFQPSGTPGWTGSSTWNGDNLPS